MSDIDNANMNVRHLLKHAFQLHSAGRIHEAISIYVTLMAERKNDPHLLYFLGTAYLQVGQAENGIEHIQRSLHINPINPEALNNLGNALHDIQQLENALASYDRALAIKPDYAEAHCNKGNTLKALNRLEEALSCYDRALALRPNFAEAYNNRGVTLKNLRRLDEALSDYAKALTIKPGYADAHNNIGNALIDLGRINEALKSYQNAAAIRPDSSDAYNNMGDALRRLNRLEEALHWHNKAIEISPNHAKAHNSRGVTLLSLGRHEDALASYNTALATNPGHVEALNNRGNVLQALDRMEEALASYNEALAIRHDNAEAHNNRGLALQGLHRYEEALLNYDNAIAINPNYAEAHYNKGNNLRYLDRFNEALASYDKALAEKPDHVGAHYNRGNVLKDLARFQEAVVSYNKAAELSLSPADARFNKSLLLLLMGDYINGWEMYESRFKASTVKHGYHTFSKPAWRGEDGLQGKNLLIYSEQGLGDVIQFCRYLPEVVARTGAHVIAEVPKSLVSLISTLNCSMTVVAAGETLPEFDAQCPMMSLPYACKTTLETVPADIPYLRSDPYKIKKWQEKLGEKCSLRVGIIWSGSESHSNDRNRSIKLERLSGLIKLETVEWHSIQKDPRLVDLDFINQHPELNLHHGEISDFCETAALVECMDLIISVDTSIAHLAGALGKPVWILVPHYPDFRWLFNRIDSPWYPTAKLYRQARADDWEGVVEAVRKDLIDLQRKTDQQ